MRPILALAFGNAALRGDPIVLLGDGTSVLVGAATAVTVDGALVPRLRPDGVDRREALAAWIAGAPAPQLVAVAFNPPHVVPTAVELAGAPPEAP